MKVGLEKSYPMPGSPEVVWGFLQDIEGVARCMPGAKITERLDDTHFKGTVSVKVGPASMAFKGNIEVMGFDATQRTLRLIGKGSDLSGTSGASLDLTARVEPGATADSSNLIGKSEVSMSGKAAAFGGRMMGTVADQILNQFAGNFAKRVSAIAAQAAAAGPPGTAEQAAVTGPAAVPSVAGPAAVAPATAAPMAIGTPSTATPGITGAVGVATPGPVSAALAANDTHGAAALGATGAAGAMPPLSASKTSTSGSAAAATAMPAAATAMPAAATVVPIAPAIMPATATAVPTTPTTVPAAATAIPTAPATMSRAPAAVQISPAAAANDLPDEPANEINALALLWAIIREWFRGLFRRKPA
jgi:carbon monoxide dehydrogenase subunit G